MKEGREDSRYLSHVSRRLGKEFMTNHRAQAHPSFLSVQELGVLRSDSLNSIPISGSRSGMPRLPSRCPDYKYQLGT